MIVNIDLELDCRSASIKIKTIIKKAYEELEYAYEIMRHHYGDEWYRGDINLKYYERVDGYDDYPHTTIEDVQNSAIGLVINLFSSKDQGYGKAISKIDEVFEERSKYFLSILKNYEKVNELFYIIEWGEEELKNLDKFVIYDRPGASPDLTKSPVGHFSRYVNTWKSLLKSQPWYDIKDQLCHYGQSIVQLGKVQKRYNSLQKEYETAKQLKDSGEADTCSEYTKHLEERLAQVKEDDAFYQKKIVECRQRLEDIKKQESKIGFFTSQKVRNKIYGDLKYAQNNYDRIEQGLADNIKKREQLEADLQKRYAEEKAKFDSDKMENILLQYPDKKLKLESEIEELKKEIEDFKLMLANHNLTI